MSEKGTWEAGDCGGVRQLRREESILLCCGDLDVARLRRAGVGAGSQEGGDGDESGKRDI